MESDLPQYNEVFFVHYQCDNFDEGEKVLSLSVHSNGSTAQYSGSEADSIREYAAKVKELLSNGLILIHWNQNQPYYGTDHLKKRYKDLTGCDLELEYSKQINLAEWLIFKYGQNYVSHPRLDNLARLNNFTGVREAELGQRIFPANRVSLLTKIYLSALNSTLKTEVTPIVKTLPHQPIIKQKPEPNGKLIIFKDSETIEKIHSELKGYFPNKEAELLRVLQGEQLSELLLFPLNQNKFVEVFRRLKYNCFLSNTDTETKNWICTTFQFVKKKFAEPQPFNESSVWDILNKGKGEPTKKERICITKWLPYKSHLQLKRERESEKL